MNRLEINPLYHTALAAVVCGTYVVLQIIGLLSYSLKPKFHQLNSTRHARPAHYRTGSIRWISRL